MELDSAHDLNGGPLTPSSPGMDKHDDRLRMSVDEDENTNKVKYSGGVRELTPAEADSDGSHQEEKEVSADDCMHLLARGLSCR